MTAVEETVVPEDVDRLLADAEDVVAQLADARAEVERLEAERNQIVRALSDAGWSNPQIGKALGMSTSNVRWIVNRREG